MSEALTFLRVGAMSKQRLEVGLSCGDSTGVLDHIKGRLGKHGNTGEPTASRENRLVRIDRSAIIRVNRVHITTLLHAKKRWYRRVSNSEGNRRRGKGQGSLSILI